MQKIFIGYDHRGGKLAYKIMEELLNKGYEVNEPFENNSEADDYPDISRAVCEKVKKTKNSVGILICGTGIGMCMAANKEKGIRAVLTNSEADAYFSRRHENANVLVLAAGYSDGVYEVKSCSRRALRMVNMFLSTDFEGDRHIRRLKKLEEIENQ